MRLWLVGLAACGAIAVRAGDASAWMRRIHDVDFVGPVAVDQRGNVFLFAFTTPRAGSVPALVKLGARSGAERWRQTLPIGGGRYNRDAKPAGLAVQPSGDVVLAGTFTDGRGKDVVRIERHGTTDGTRRWRSVVRGDTGDGHAEATALALDDQGNVVVCGGVSRGYDGNVAEYYDSEDLFVAKFAGNDGREVWRVQLDGGANLFDEALAVGTDGAGDVLATGLVATGQSTGRVVVLKLAAETGAVTWRNDLTSRGGLVAVTRTGDAVVAGFGGVARVAGATGSVLWESNPLGFGEMLGVGELPSGDIAILNSASGLPGRVGMLVVVLDGGSGAERWRRVVDGVTDLDGSGFATTSTGQVFLGGQLFAGLPKCYDAFAAALDGATGAVVGTSAIDGTATARSCEDPCVGSEEPGPCPPSPDGIDQDYLRSMAAGRTGEMVVGGALSDGARGRPHGFVATIAAATEQGR